MRLPLIAAALLLAACSQHIVTEERPPVGAMAYAEVNQCVARHFGVEPLPDEPRIAYMTVEGLRQGSYRSNWGKVHVEFGPPFEDRIYLRPGMTPEQHNTVLTHEEVHRYQVRRLDRWDAGREANERHAQEHQEAWRDC